MHTPPSTRFLVLLADTVHGMMKLESRRDPAQNPILRRIKTKHHKDTSGKVSSVTGKSQSFPGQQVIHLHKCRVETPFPVPMSNILFCFETESCFVAQAVLVPLVLRE